MRLTMTGEQFTHEKLKETLKSTDSRRLSAPISPEFTEKGREG